MWVIPYLLENSTTVLVAVIIPVTSSPPHLESSQFPILESDLSVQIRKLIHKTLPSHMWPFWIVTMFDISDIPVTLNGKISIPDLAEKCKLALDRESHLTISQTFDQQKILETLTRIWNHALPDWDPSYNSSNFAQHHFLNLGGSSLSVMWCVEKIMSEFGICVSSLLLL